MIYFAHFFAGVFLINGIPHFVQGICGNPFQSPFAKPPGIGESSPVVNVLWGAFNFIVGYFLLFQVESFEIGLNISTFVFLTGGIFPAICLSWHFGKVRNTQKSQ